MAQGSAKRIFIENQKILSFLFKGSLFTFILHLLIALYVEYYQSYHWMILFSVSTLGELLGYYSLANWSQPSLSSDKKRIEGSGMDLSSAGNYIVQYTMDYIYITWFVHLTSLLWWKIWWTYMIIPIYGIFKIGLLVKSMLGGSSAPFIPQATSPSLGSSGDRKIQRK